eukprot:g848.t1
MKQKDLVRDGACYRAVLSALRRSPNGFPGEVALAVLEEMEDQNLCNGNMTYNMILAAVAATEKEGGADSSWRLAVTIFRKLCASGLAPNTATYEILGKACAKAPPLQLYDALKWAGVPEAISFSIANKSSGTEPRDLHASM